jgi:hypothetical protein
MPQLLNIKQILLKVKLLMNSWAKWDIMLMLLLMEKVELLIIKQAAVLAGLLWYPNSVAEKELLV